MSAKPEFIKSLKKLISKTDFLKECDAQTAKALIEQKCLNDYSSKLDKCLTGRFDCAMQLLPCKASRQVNGLDNVIDMCYMMDHTENAGLGLML
jgi:hypothetical protein